MYVSAFVATASFVARDMDTTSPSVVSTSFAADVTGTTTDTSAKNANINTHRRERRERRERVPSTRASNDVTLRTLTIVNHADARPLNLRRRAHVRPHSGLGGNEAFDSRQVGFLSSF